MDLINDNDLVLVTGASGYIATHIVKQLLELGYRVRGTVRSLTDDKKVAPLRKLVEKSKHELELVEADLLNEYSWLDAVKGCTYVLHTASPFPNTTPKNENELIEPAVNGTLFVLKACVQPDSNVKRVVLTSSVAAVSGDSYVKNKCYSENDWSVIDGLSPYPKSKTLAEKAAWDFLKEREKNNLKCFELAVINPGFVIGPLIHDSPCTSIEPIKNMMNREIPMVPHLYMPTCDVRDVALAHIRAMKMPEANGKRHLILTTVETSTFKDWCIILDAEFRSKGYSVPMTVAPNFLLKFASIFDSRLKLIVPMLGIKTNYDNSRLVNELKIQPTELKKSLIDMAYSLIERGIVPKKYN